MGDFTSAAVPSAVTSALTRLFAWKFALHGTPVTGTVTVMDKTFNRISGHRDANPTSCPGAKLYAKLPALRTAVAARIGSRSRSVLHRSVDAGGTPDVLSVGSATTRARRFRPGPALGVDPAGSLRRAHRRRAGTRCATSRSARTSPETAGPTSSP